MKKALTLALTLAMLAMSLVGCNSDSVATDPTTDATQPTAAPVTNDFDGFGAQKIGSVPYRVSNNLAESSGMIYSDANSKYGIVTLDGTGDTGAKYTECSAVGQFFEVTTAADASADNPTSMNCIGVVDANGKEIIPMQYAAVDSLSDRFIKVIEVTELTENEDEALLYASSAMVSLTAAEGDPLFKGVWYIYDVTTGKKVPGATGTNRYIVSAHGNFVEFVTDDEETKIVDADGNALPEGAKLFENGCYSVSSGSTGTVYRGDKTKAFDFDSSNGYDPRQAEGDYIVAAKYVDSQMKYVLMDIDGNVVSAQFDSLPYVCGELLTVNDTVMDFQGNVVVEGTYGSLYEEECFGGAWFAREDDDYVLFKKDGTILFQGSESDGLSFDPYTTFSISKSPDDGRKYYCFADKDFTIKGGSFAPWLIRTSNEDGTDNIVDAMSGKTLIQGYDQFQYITVPGTGIYVYAYKNGATDIYLVK